MVPTQTPTKVLTAPPALGLDTRADFRRAAVALLDQLPDGEGQLIVDLAKTVAVDSAGLGALMLIQRRASERRQTVVLKAANDEIRFLLVLTKLDDLFLYETAAA